MKPKETPTFHFNRRGKIITCWFDQHPVKNSEGKEQWIGFSRECESELEAAFLHDYLCEFQHLIRKEYFTQGFDTHKKKQKNWYL